MANAIKGRIFAYNNPKTKTLEIITDNRGQSPGQLTHNIFSSKRDAETSQVHDDMNYGHGNPIPAGTDKKPGTVVQQFPLGQLYNGHRIKVGAWHRVGVRDRAWQIFQIPEAGEVVEIPFEKMRPNERRNAGWNPVKSSDDMDVGAQGALAAVFQVLNNGPIRSVVGHVEIKPIAYDNDPKRLRGWEMWFRNEAPAPATRGRTTGFIGTAVLTNAKGEGTKNAGIGLESMVCPDADYAVMQFIEAGGDYGVKLHDVRAQAKTRIRLGIRGHSATEAQLPSLADGSVKVNFKKFKAEAGDANSDWFETDKLTPKMGEKKGLVELFHAGERINDRIPDTVYAGDDAFVRAEFKDPPRVQIEATDDGWKITVTNNLPEDDDLGPVGFTGRLQFFDGERGYDDFAAVTPKDFTPDDREHVWYVSHKSMLAGTELKAGTDLRFDTGALGWRAVVKLPRKNATVDTDKDRVKKWELCESNFKRARLYPVETLRGAAATKAGALPAPKLEVRAVDDSAATPGGGWVVAVESAMPDKVGAKKVGMIATPQLGHHGADRAQLPSRSMKSTGDVAEWFIPRDMQVGGYRAEPGQTLKIDTGALGWIAELELPADGEAAAADAWTFNEARYMKADLEHANL